MLRKRQANWVAQGIALTLFGLAIGLLLPAFRHQLAAANRQKNQSPTPFIRHDEIQERTFTINPGTESDAYAYYKSTFDELGLNVKGLSPQALVESQNLTIAFQFLGYDTLTPQQVEELSSAELMKRFPNDVLSAVFFAPKITDVSVKPINMGWRKIVRFTAHGEAKKRGIVSAFLLFNKFQGAGCYD